MICTPNESIENTKMEFEKSFDSGAFYNRQTQDTVHLKSILKFLKINKSIRILD